MIHEIYASIKEISKDSKSFISRIEGTSYVIFLISIIVTYHIFPFFEKINPSFNNKIAFVTILAFSAIYLLCFSLVGGLHALRKMKYKNKIVIVVEPDIFSVQTDINEELRNLRQVFDINNNLPNKIILGKYIFSNNATDLDYYLKRYSIQAIIKIEKNNESIENAKSYRMNIFEGSCIDRQWDPLISAIEATKTSACALDELRFYIQNMYFLLNLSENSRGENIPYTFDEKFLKNFHDSFFDNFHGLIYSNINNLLILIFTLTKIHAVFFQNTNNPEKKFILNTSEIQIMNTLFLIYEKTLFSEKFKDFTPQAFQSFFRLSFIFLFSIKVYFYDNKEDIIQYKKFEDSYSRIFQKLQQISADNSVDISNTFSHTLILLAYRNKKEIEVIRNAFKTFPVASYNHFFSMDNLYPYIILQFLSKQKQALVDLREEITLIGSRYFYIVHEEKSREKLYNKLLLQLSYFIEKLDVEDVSRESLKKEKNTTR